MSKTTKTPKLRFKGFTDAWEQCTFQQIAKLRRGLTYHPSDIRQSGICVLRSSNIKEENFILSKDDIFVDEKAVNIKHAEFLDILITAANGSTYLVGKHALIDKKPRYPLVPGGFMLLAECKKPYFINASMSSHWFKNFINMFVAGGNGAIGNLNKPDLEKQVLKIPTENEQQKIGEFFKHIDSLITLHQ